MIAKTTWRFFTIIACWLFIFSYLRAEDGVKAVVITVSDAMRFDVKRIEVFANQKLHVQLRNVGTFPKNVMAHNWVLLKSHASAEKFSAAAASAKDQNYMPSALSAEVIASIPVLGAKETGEVDFVAPGEPGTYPFLCSFPGHFQIGMHGELVVRPAR